MNEHWTARFSGPIIFVILTMIAVGAYLAFTIPVSVFPSTDFPRIVVGIDNGVAPINQMQVTVTRPIEEAMNSVPGLEQVRSNTSRGSAEVNPVLFNWSAWTCSRRCNTPTRRWRACSPRCRPAPS